jgi:RHS repeat-associated protein
MLHFSTALRAACAALLSFVVSLPLLAQTNSAPQIVSRPERLATIKLGFSYAVRAEDADADTLRYLLPIAPANATIDAASGELRWRPTPSDIGKHAFRVAVEDGRGGLAEQPFELKVVDDFCPIYPIALPKSRIDGLAAGALIEQLERGTGAGNFSWLSWTGATDAPTMATSLMPPGDSDTYVDPDDASDHLLNIGDWAQGSTGSMNAAAIRAAMDVLKTQDIILPVWDDTRGQGSNFDYHVQRFVTVRLRDYQLTGQGWLSFEFKGEATCYNRAPTALPQTLVTDEDVPLLLTLTGTDPEDDALVFSIVDAPTHGTLSGTAPDLVYTPNPGYFGPDSFTFRVNDGQLDSEVARVDIEVRLVNFAPEIVSPPVTVATEGQDYRYDVDAEDPDDDTLDYALDRAPQALAIDAVSGVIAGRLDDAFVQPVRTFNSQCYVIPDDVGLEDGEGTIIAPLFQRVRSAIAKGSNYVAPQTLAWDRQNDCLGCHVQNQTLLGLQGSMERADVDEAAAEYLLAKILGSQQADGSIRRSHPEYSRTQTAFALWALSYVPDRARTLAVREKGLRFFLARVTNADIRSYWTYDHSSGWLGSNESATALIALSANRYLRDISRLPNVTPAQIEFGLQLRTVLPRVAQYFLSRPVNDGDNLALAFGMIGLAEALPHIDDAALRSSTQARIAQLNTTLRARERAGGGWHRTGGSVSDALTSAWVGFALDELDPPLTDPVVLRNIEFLLDNQNGANGTWPTNSGLFTTHLGTTGLVMAYLPVALEHLGNPDLTLGHLKLEAQGDGYVLSAEAINRGLADVDATSTVRFFLGTDASGDVIGEVQVGPLHSGESRWVSITLGELPTDDVSATIAADGIDECLDDNNATRAALTIARATEPYDLFDTQSFLINLEDANAAPSITSQPVTEFDQGRPYDYQVTVADPDVGDAHEFELTTAPAGLYINPLTGRFSYDLSVLAARTHTVTVLVTDLRGATAQQTFQLTVHANHPPVIGSTPGLHVYVGESYSYDVDATDPDDDTLVYRLDGAPLTMSIDADTGVITWTPETRHIGNQSVAVVADDGRGGSARQVYTLVVEALPQNRAPQITTTAPPRVDAGATYTYPIGATDPDNDPLSYMATVAAAGTNVVADSGVLTWLANDAGLTSSVRVPNAMCREPSSAADFDPVVRWHWDGSSTLPFYDQVMNSPVVIPLNDTNGDGVVDGNDVPDVAFVAYGGSGNDRGDGIIRVVRGDTGEERFSVSDAAARVPSYANLAAGDIDGDGIAEIIAPRMQGGIIVINRDGSIKWSNPSPARSWNVGGASIADLEGDGSPEIVLGKTVYSSTGQIKWQGTAPYEGDSYSPSIGSFGIAVDLRAEPGLEVVVGPSMYSSTGTLLWRYDAIGDGMTAIGDLNRDGSGDIVVVGGGRVVALSANGAAMWTASLGDGGRGGAPTIADFDADGQRDIGVAGRNFYFVFTHTGQLKWKQPIVDVSSNITGSTLFDFDGDGAVEVMQADERKFRVFDGATGRVRLEMDNSSGTAYEYPVVADVDRDGSADILLASNLYYGPSGQKGLRMISSESRAWMPTRSIWNQHAYHVDNVNDDGTIPAQAANSWLTHNSFRLNTFPDRNPLGLADLALFDLRLQETDSDSTITVLVQNRGLAPTAAGTSVGIYSGAELIGTLDVPVLAAGEELTLTLAGFDPAAVDNHLFARIDEGEAIAECLDNNNATAAAYFAVRASDPEGLFDSQRFTVSIDHVNAAPTMLSTLLPPASVSAPYRFTVQARDNDLGDALRYELAAAPTGLTIEAVSGELRWTPTADQDGNHVVRVRVTDLGGLSVERNFDLLVSDNHPPQITSTPATTATIGVEYQYDVEANDADGDALSYSLTQSPTGMQIDGSSGLIRWTPSAVASVDVEVRVLDSRGGFALQRYTLQVSGPVNHPPVITSTPPTNASPGRAYAYLIDATDPDNDVLSVLLPVKPAGMTLNEFTGQLMWTPTAAQLGTHAVQVQVIDGRGGSATQSFNIVVGEIVGNQPPSILSTPPFTAKAGREYRYPVQAEDPNGDTLDYSLIQAPSGMTIAADGTIAWTPSAAGSQAVRVRVADAQSYVEQSWSISVLAADVPLNADVHITPDPAPLGGSITIQIAVSGAAGQTTVSGTVDGTPIVLDQDGSTTIPAPTTPGSHTIVVTVTDGHDSDTTEVTFNVIDPNDTVAPVVQIHAPREGETEQLLVLTSPADAIVSVSDDNLRSWTLKMFERGAPGNEGILVASGNAAVNNAQVGRIDPTLLMNGQYSLVLRGEDASGNAAQDVVAVSIEGAMKLGHFSITFEDLNLPVSGIPVTVSRTYDTRQRHRALDFGQGWSLSYQNVRIYESRRPGFAWEFKVYPSGPLGLIPNYCMESALGNVVSVTLADGKVEKFRARAYPECNQVLPLVDVELRFEAMPGTDGRLEPLDNSSGRLMNGSISPLDDAGTPIDPNLYRYIDADGVEYTLDQNFGLRQIHERTGDNLITFGRDGIVHSNGTSVSFVRDAAGRITRVIAPDASELGYEYNAAGDLAAFVDAGGNRTTYTYETGHYLRDIIDPRGVRVSRNEYDDDGRLVAIIDADGNRIEYTRDIDGRVETVKDRNGGRTVYIYNDRGDVLAETNPLNQTTHRTYDGDGNELTRTDALGRTQRWTYDTLGNVLTETNGENETTTKTFGSFNHLLTQTDAAGRVVLRNTWRNVQLPGTGVEIYPGPLVSVTDAAGAITGFGYDPDSGELSRITTAAGATTTYVFDGRGYKTAETDALGNRTDYVNDDKGRAIEERRQRTVRAPDGTTSLETLITRYGYDDNGRLTSVEHPDGSITRSEYDGAGNLTAEVDALDRRTEHDYNDRNERVETRYPDGTAESRSYDANGNLLSQTDRAGRITTFVYDAANRLTETIHPDDTPATDADNARSIRRYDAAGQLIEEVDENGRATQFAYDDAGRRTEVIQPDPLTGMAGSGPIEVTVYDNIGRRERLIDANGGVTRFVYNAADRLIETIHPDPIEDDGNLANNPRVLSEYDGFGRKLSDTDETGLVKRYAYDKLGRLAAVVLPDPQSGVNSPLVNGASPDPGTLTTRYVYDEVGNRIEQIDAAGRITRWEYDAMGRETARTLPGGERETRAYNAAGELTSHTDFNGSVTTYRYDAAGRLERTEYADGRVETFDYDEAGNRIGMTSPEGQWSWVYDARDRVVRETQPSGVIEYEYDAVGNRTLTRHGEGMALSEAHYDFDALNRLASAQQGSAPATVFAYDAVGNLVQEMQGDALTRQSHDTRNRLVEIHSTKAGNTLQRYTYGLDGAGRRLHVDEVDGTGAARRTVYSYDRIGRLIGETESVAGVAVRSAEFTYDKVGNRSSIVQDGVVRTATFDDNDRLLTQGDETFAYDDNGNQIRRTSPAGVVDYVYDERDRLVDVAAPGGLRVGFDYDADGNRIARRLKANAAAAEVATGFVVDRSFGLPEVIAELDGSGAIAARYLHGDQLLQQETRAGANTVLRYPLRDALGSTRYLVDDLGTITDSFRFTAWGEASLRTGSTDVAHRFAGEYWEDSLGLSYNRARWYDPAQARLTSVDPWEGSPILPTTLNKYSYVLNDPVLFIDPSGREFTLSGQSLAQNINSILATGAQASFRVTLRKVGRELMCVAVEEVVETVIIEALTGGIYVLVDGDGLYGGRTNDFERRYREHARDVTKNIERWLARFHFDGKGNDLRLLEQFFLDFFSDRNLTNEVRAIANEGGSANTRALRERLKGLDFCK